MRSRGIWRGQSGHHDIAGDVPAQARRRFDIIGKLGRENAGDVIDFLLRNYEIQMDHSLLLSKILQRGVRVVLVAPSVSDATARLMGLIPARSLDDGIRIAADLAGAGSRISFFPCPQRCLPVLSGKDA